MDPSPPFPPTPSHRLRALPSPCPGCLSARAASLIGCLIMTLVYAGWTMVMYNVSLIRSRQSSGRGEEETDASCGVETGLCDGSFGSGFDCSRRLRRARSFDPVQYLHESLLRHHDPSLPGRPRDLGVPAARRGEMAQPRHLGRLALHVGLWRLWLDLLCRVGRLSREFLHGRSLRHESRDAATDHDFGTYTHSAGGHSRSGPELDCDSCAGCAFHPHPCLLPRRRPVRLCPQ
jgi:hypothetical protein